MNVHSSTASGVNGLNLSMEAAQLVVGAAILDSRFRTELLQNRDRALRTVDRLAVAPAHVRLTAGDRRALAAIQATDLQQFAVGVERLRRTIRPGGAARPASHEERLVG